MAYMSQERKKRIAKLLKDVVKPYNLKYTLSVINKSTLKMTITSGDVDFFGDSENKDAVKADYLLINPYWFRCHFHGESVEVIGKILSAMNDGNHDRSDIMTDYFDVGWYVEIVVGRHNEPYKLTGKKRFWDQLGDCWEVDAKEWDALGEHEREIITGGRGVWLAKRVSA